MEFYDIKKDQMVWTMIGNYPYEVKVIELRPCNIPHPRGTFQRDRIVIWREDENSTHTREPHQVFESKEAIKKHLFPECCTPVLLVDKNQPIK